MPKITSRMAEAFLQAKTHGALYRHRGGFWAPRDAELNVHGVPQPWYTSGQTIYGLMDRKAFEVVERLPRGDPLLVRPAPGCEVREMADGFYVY